jgi:hypothetical protein
MQANESHPGRSAGECPGSWRARRYLRISRLAATAQDGDCVYSGPAPVPGWWGGPGGAHPRSLLVVSLGRPAFPGQQN